MLISRFSLDVNLTIREYREGGRAQGWYALRGRKFNPDLSRYAMLLNAQISGIPVLHRTWSYDFVVHTTSSLPAAIKTRRLSVGERRASVCSEGSSPEADCSGVPIIKTWDCIGVIRLYRKSVLCLQRFAVIGRARSHGVLVLSRVWQAARKIVRRSVLGPVCDIA